ncbi:MAG: SGNH hydrolase domain-containing protein [Pseudorhodoplanes sp.]
MISRTRIAKTACAAGLAAAAISLAWPAAAQFFPFDDRFFGPPRQQAPRPRVPTEAEQMNAPAAKQPEAPPTIRILVLGDSMADWLAYGLEEALAETPEIGIVRKHKGYSGLIRYEQRSETEWSKVARDLIAHEKPQAIVILVGLHDRQAMRERIGVVAPAKPAPAKPGTTEAPRAVTPQAGAQPAPPKPATNPNDDEAPVVAAPEPQRVRPAMIGPAEFRTEKWEELYGARVDETIAALKSGNVPVLWVGVPAIRGQKSTADLQYLNDLVKARVEKAGLIFVNPWDGFVDDRNNFMQRGPDETGQVRVLRTYDGIHFTKFGARKLAHYVERDLRRVLREPIPAALNVPAEPAPQAQPAKPTGPATRPLAGPVILLGTPLNEPDDLLGGTPPPPGKAVPPPPALDPVANRMLVNGQPMRAEAGRADDMSWPPRLPNLATNEPLPPTGAPLTIVRAQPAVQQAALQPGQKPGVPGQPGARIAGQPVLQGQFRQQAQAPTFWRRPQQDSGQRFFFGLFGR